MMSVTSGDVHDFTVIREDVSDFVLASYKCLYLTFELKFGMVDFLNSEVCNSGTGLYFKPSGKWIKITLASGTLMVIIICIN